MRRVLALLHRHSHRLFAPCPPVPPRKTTATTNLPFLLHCLLSDDTSLPAAVPPPPPPPTSGVPNEELKKRLETYYGLMKRRSCCPASVFEAVLECKLADANSETDDELTDELQSKPLPKLQKDRDFGSDFEEMHGTDEELNDLYDTKPYAEKKIPKDDSRVVVNTVKSGILHSLL